MLVQTVCSLGLAPAVNPVYDVVLLPAAIAIGLVGLARLPERAVTLSFFTIAVMGLVQIGRWHGGWSEHMIIAGRMPVGDSKEYLSDALAFLSGSELSPYTSKRPIFVSSISIVPNSTD